MEAKYPVSTYHFKLGIVQFTPGHLQVEKNLSYVKGEIIRLAEKGAEIVLLPELWATGPLSLGDRINEESLSLLIQELFNTTKSLEVYVIGTLPEFPDSIIGLDNVPRLFNTTYLFGSDEVRPVYRKIHLFSPMDEDKVFIPGSEPSFLSVKLAKGKADVGFLTCFDLRFPELSRAMVFNGIELILLSALWPKERREAFEILIRARAIENQCFVAASNAWGMAGGLFFGGGSCVAGPGGELLAMAKDGEDSMLVNIDLGRVTSYREKFFTARPPRHWWSMSEKKIVGEKELAEIVSRRRRAGQKIVFTNGCFDILHSGHVTYLEKSRRLGDLLIVGLNSDRSVKALKGKGRPVMNQDKRATVLAALSSVDYVVIFDESTPEYLINSIAPDFLVKGSDWQENDIAGADTVKKLGGNVVRIPLVHGLSTTSVIKKIQNSTI